MGLLAKSAALVLIVAGFPFPSVRAGPAPAPEPVITPAAILPRADTATFAWYADGQTAGETIYAPWVYNPSSLTYTSSGDYFRRCAVSASTSCVMYTGCSSGYMVAADTSSYCGLKGATGGPSPTQFCSNHLLEETLGATGVKSWFWCDEPTLTGYTFYITKPTQAAVSTSSASTASTSTTTSPAATSTTPATDDNDDTPVGAIAGGVVGGVAALAAIGFAIWWIMRRDKKKKQAAQANASSYQPAPHGGVAGPQSPYQQGYPPQQTDYYPQTAYQGSEAKPQGVAVAGNYYPQQAYPLGPYDPHVAQPHVAQHTAASPPPQEMGAPVESHPHELPAQQSTR